MSIYSLFLSLLCVLSICSGQFLQPKKFLADVLDLHEKSRNVLSGGDSMKLNVDLTSAKDFPVREDLRLRVFNKDNNVTVCDTKLFDHVDNGHFPCSFDENDAQLRHGANNFELEVYSNINWKIYATQKVPDIHYFDNFAFEGYYDKFVHEHDLDAYVQKTVLTSIFAVLMAGLFMKGPGSVCEDVQCFLGDQIGARAIMLYPYLAILSKAGYDTASRGMFFLSTGATQGFFQLLQSLQIGLVFLYNIYTAGLASPYSMLLSGWTSISSVLYTASYSLLTLLVNLGGDSQVIFSRYIKLFILASQNGYVNCGSLLSAFGSLFQYYSLSLLKNVPVLTQNLFTGLINSPKSFLLVFIATGQFLLDIFSAGLSSPAGMIVSGIFIFSSFISNNFHFCFVFYSISYLLSSVSFFIVSLILHCLIHFFYFFCRLTIFFLSLFLFLFFNISLFLRLISFFLLVLFPILIIFRCQKFGINSRKKFQVVCCEFSSGSLSSLYSPKFPNPKHRQ